MLSVTGVQELLPAMAASARRAIKSVSFREAMEVVLIPSRGEYSAISYDIWWAHEDYSNFQQSAISEIRMYSLCETVSLKTARSELYQPSEADRSAWGTTSHTGHRHQATSPSLSSPSSNTSSSSSRAASTYSGEEEDLELFVTSSNQSFFFDSSSQRSKRLHHQLMQRVVMFTLSIPLFSYFIMQKVWL
jgi:hypothetical protein